MPRRALPAPHEPPRPVEHWQISTLPAAIQPFVEAYEESLAFECTGDHPYLFSTAASYQYGLTSSAWTHLVKGVFARHENRYYRNAARNLSVSFFFLKGNAIHGDVTTVVNMTTVMGPPH